jgi:hypothetical protein
MENFINTGVDDGRNFERGCRSFSMAGKDRKRQKAQVAGVEATRYNCRLSPCPPHRRLATPGTDGGRGRRERQVPATCRVVGLSGMSLLPPRAEPPRSHRAARAQTTGDTGHTTQLQFNSTTWPKARIIHRTPVSKLSTN